MNHLLEDYINEVVSKYEVRSLWVRVVYAAEIHAADMLTAVRVLPGIATVSQQSLVHTNHSGRRVMDLLIKYAHKGMEEIMDEPAVVDMIQKEPGVKFVKVLDREI